MRLLGCGFKFCPYNFAHIILVSFLGGFGKLVKAIISYVMSVYLSA